MKKILILGDRTDYRFHCLRELQPLIGLLEKEYEVRLQNDYAALTKEELIAYDAVINYMDNWEAKGSRQTEDAIVSYVEEGGKLLVLHCGIITGSAAKLLQLCGADFLGHAEYQVLSYARNSLQHPVTDGLESFSMGEEPYRFSLNSPEDTQIILTYSMEGKQYPAGWTRRQGKGHMLYLAFGHNSASFLQPEAAGLCIKAMEWFVSLFPAG